MASSLSNRKTVEKRVREWAHGRRREWDRAARRTRSLCAELTDPPAGAMRRAGAAWAAYRVGNRRAARVLLMQAVAERRAWLELTAWGRRGRAFGSLTPASRSWLVGR